MIYDIILNDAKEKPADEVYRLKWMHMALWSHTDYFNQDVFDKDAVRSIKPFCIDMVSHV